MPHLSSQIALYEGLRLEARDSYGKWLQARILKLDRRKNTAMISFLTFGDKWNELLNIDNPIDLARLAPLGQHCLRKRTMNQVPSVGDVVEVMSVPNLWSRAIVVNVDGDQLMIHTDERKTERWFHLDLDARLLPKEDEHEENDPMMRQTTTTRTTSSSSSSSSSSSAVRPVLTKKPSTLALLKESRQAAVTTTTTTVMPTLLEEDVPVVVPVATTTSAVNDIVMPTKKQQPQQPHQETDCTFGYKAGTAVQVWDADSYVWCPGVVLECGKLSARVEYTKLEFGRALSSRSVPLLKQQWYPMNDATEMKLLASASASSSIDNNNKQKTKQKAKKEAKKEAKRGMIPTARLPVGLTASSRLPFLSDKTRLPPLQQATSTTTTTTTASNRATAATIATTAKTTTTTTTGFKPPVLVPGTLRGPRYLLKPSALKGLKCGVYDSVDFRTSDYRWLHGTVKDFFPTDHPHNRFSGSFSSSLSASGKDHHLERDKYCRFPQAYVVNFDKTAEWIPAVHLGPLVGLNEVDEEEEGKDGDETTATTAAAAAVAAKWPVNRLAPSSFYSQRMYSSLGRETPALKGIAVGSAVWLKVARNLEKPGTECYGDTFVWVPGNVFEQLSYGQAQFLCSYEVDGKHEMRWFHVACQEIQIHKPTTNLVNGDQVLDDHNNNNNNNNKSDDHQHEEKTPPSPAVATVTAAADVASSSSSSSNQKRPRPDTLTDTGGGGRESKRNKKPPRATTPPPAFMSRSRSLLDREQHQTKGDDDAIPSAFNLELVKVGAWLDVKRPSDNRWVPVTVSSISPFGRVQVDFVGDKEVTNGKLLAFYDRTSPVVMSARPMMERSDGSDARGLRFTVGEEYVYLHPETQDWTTGTALKKHGAQVQFKVSTPVPAAKIKTEKLIYGRVLTKPKHELLWFHLDDRNLRTGKEDAKEAQVDDHDWVYLDSDDEAEDAVMVEPPSPKTTPKTQQQQKPSPQEPQQQEQQQQQYVPFNVAQGLQSEVRRRFVGLQNLGNTCYMNSALQLLASCPPLLAYFRSTQTGQHWKRVLNDGSGKRGVQTSPSKGRICVRYNNLLKHLCKDADHSSTSPEAFKRTLDNITAKFEGYRQHDCQELLNYLLDALHADLNLYNDEPMDAKTPALAASTSASASVVAVENDPVVLGRLNWEAFQRGNASVISDLFFGQLRNVVTCTVCAYKSHSFDVMNQLSLDIPSELKAKALLKNTTSSNAAAAAAASVNDDVCVTVQDCLSLSISQDLLEGENQYNCPHCKTKTDATKQLFVNRAPPVLLLQLKRFHAVTRERLSTLIQIPETLDLTPHFGKLPTDSDSTSAAAAAEYVLTGVVNHIEVRGLKHYTCYARVDGNLFPEQGNNHRRQQWVLFDDSRCSEVPASEVLTPSVKPYLLMYVRKPTTSMAT